jgi:hypothetical protein
MGKVLNLLFDTFHSAKYFSGVVIPCFCPFCVSCCSGQNTVKFLCLVLVSYCNFLRFFCIVKIDVTILNLVLIMVYLNLALYVNS